MPLPDAKDPKTSNLYAQLRTSQLDAVTQTAFDQVKDPVFINSEWEDEARRLKLWGEIAGKASSSGPLVGTMKIVPITVDDTTMTEVFRPESGEVWVVLNMSDSVSGISGAVVRNGQYYDGTSQSGFFWASSTSSGFVWSDDSNFPDSTFYVTNEVYLRAQWSGTFTSVTGYVTAIRVR